MKLWRSLVGRLRADPGREHSVLVLFAAAYFLTGKAGLAFGYLNPSVTCIFPPAGIALGALLVLGYRVWPVILLAATAPVRFRARGRARRADSRGRQHG